jgi:polysaccharide export outer membrane protein
MNPKNVWRVARALVLLALCSAGVGAQSSVDSASGFVEETARRAAQARLRPGDRIELQFRRDRELNSSVGVSELGDAVFPKLGSLRVSGMSIAQLQDSLRRAYATYLRHPELEVGVLRRVTVNGEVRLPNVYWVDLTSSVRDAIARAGGMLETANRSKVYVVRDGTRLRVKDWDRNEGPEYDLLSGDQVLVGRKSWLTLNALPVISTSVIVIGLIRSLRNS